MISRSETVFATSSLWSSEIDLGMELDWEEGAFRGLLSIWHRVRHFSKPPNTDPRVARLEDTVDSLRVVAQLMAAEPVRVLVARDSGGIRGRDLLLPKEFRIAPTSESNQQLYVIRICISAVMRRLTRGRSRPHDPTQSTLESIRIAQRATEICAQELPRFGERYQQACEWVLQAHPETDSLHDQEKLLGQYLWGEWIANADCEEINESKPSAMRKDTIETEAVAPSVDELTRVTLKQNQGDEVTPTHVFEKTQTLDQYRGGQKDLDGADELADHLEALRDINLGNLIRTDESSHSMLRADLDLGSDVPDVADSTTELPGIPYDEWDVRRKQYRKSWCTVYPRRFDGQNTAWAQDVSLRHHRLIRELRRRLEIHRAGRSESRRQFDGPDVDLAALIDANAARSAGRPMDRRLYLRQDKKRRDFVATVLLDISLSTDSWVDNHRVLDVAREAVFVWGEVADSLGDRFQVLAFASQTRNRCQVWQLKGWREPWVQARGRLGALEPVGYTRVGPALRHATAELIREPADRHLLLLISDGKPTDYDRYEGRYGIADIRQALSEAERVNVCTHALAVDNVARDTLPALFGHGRWHILPNPNQLPEALTSVYGRLTQA